jgi:hypothetical protein
MTVRGDEALAALHAGKVLECVQCGERYGREDEDELLESWGDEPACSDCECKGFIARAPADRVADRLPPGMPWSPLGDWVLDYSEELGLTTQQLTLVWALERHRRRGDEWVYPGIDRLARLGTARGDEHDPHPREEEHHLDGEHYREGDVDARAHRLLSICDPPRRR